MTLDSTSGSPFSAPAGHEVAELLRAHASPPVPRAGERFAEVRNSGVKSDAGAARPEAIIASGTTTSEQKLAAFNQLLPGGGDKQFKIGDREYTISKKQLSGGRSETNVFTVGSDGKNYVYLRGILGQHGEIAPQVGVDNKPRPIMGERWSAKMNDKGELVLAEDANATVSAGQAAADRKAADAALAAANKDFTTADAERAKAQEVLKAAEEAKRQAESLAAQAAEANRAAAKLNQSVQEDVAVLMSKPGEQPSVDLAKQRIAQIQGSPDSLIRLSDLSGQSGYQKEKPSVSQKDAGSGKVATTSEGTLDDGANVKTTDVRDSVGNLLRRDVHAQGDDPDNNNGISSFKARVKDGTELEFSHVTDISLKWSNAQHAYETTIAVGSGQKYTLKSNDLGSNVELVTTPRSQQSADYIHPYDLRQALNQPYLTGKQADVDPKVSNEPVQGKPGWTRTEFSFNHQDTEYTVPRDVSVGVSTINDADGRMMERTMTFDDKTPGKSVWSFTSAAAPEYQGIEGVTQIHTKRTDKGYTITVRAAKDKKIDEYSFDADTNGKPIGGPVLIKK